MSKEKQIEEIKNILIKTCKRVRNPQEDYMQDRYAEALYKAGYRKLPENIGEFSDGYHTFNELYHHRAILFSVICNMFPEKAWKSKLHDTGDMFDGMFIVGIETEQGQATYHYDIEPYWDMFKVKELEKAPKWDGHTPSDAIQRIGNIKQSEGEWLVSAWDNEKQEYIEIPYIKHEHISPYCSLCRTDALLDEAEFGMASNYCPNCGAKMKGGEE